MVSPTTPRTRPALLARQGRPAVLAMLLAAVFGTGAAVWSSSPAAPPPSPAATPALTPTPATDSRAAAAVEAGTTTTEIAASESPARSEIPTRTAVVGRALDSGGAPLVGF